MFAVVISSSTAPVTPGATAGHRLYARLANRLRLATKTSLHCHPRPLTCWHRSQPTFSNQQPSTLSNGGRGTLPSLSNQQQFEQNWRAYHRGDRQALSSNEIRYLVRQERSWNGPPVQTSQARQRIVRRDEI